MNGLPLDIIVAAGLLLLNRVVPRAKLAEVPIYVAIQLVNLSAIGWFAVKGVHGLGHLPLVGWIVAGPFFLHVVMNASQRSRALDEVGRR
jgi:hypothetical protein